MIYINNRISIDEKEIHEEFIRSSGPGGQNVNKVATAVQLRFDVRNSPSLSDDVRDRLIRAAGRKITKDGDRVIKAARHRTQEQNRKDAIERLAELVKKSSRAASKTKESYKALKGGKGTQDRIQTPEKRNKNNASINN